MEKTLVLLKPDTLQRSLVGPIISRLEQRGLKIGVARTIIEVFALSSGWLMGGTVGYASPFMALLIGPIVQIILPYVDFRKK